MFPNRARKEAPLPSLTVGVRKTQVLTHSPPDGSRRNGHAPPWALPAGQLAEDVAATLEDVVAGRVTEPEVGVTLAKD